MITETNIFSNLIKREDYFRKVFPFLKEEYFSDPIEKNLFLTINEYVAKYNKQPTKEALKIDIKNKLKNDKQINEALEYIESLTCEENTDIDWLISNTEKFCQERAIYNALMRSIQIIDKKDIKEKGIIPELLKNAISVSFDHSVGHDFFNDFEARYDFYHRKENKIPFDIDYFNYITKGGLPNKSLTCIIASTGVGKSLFMCHMAAANLRIGKNVLYITLEMAQEKIAERIDANLLNVTIEELYNMPKKIYISNMENIKNKFTGKLIIKEYPTSSASVTHFRHLLSELYLKKNFKPDIIYVDYINICASSRVKYSNVNSYTYVKSIAEELRGLAVEQNVPVITATQTVRSAMGSSDMELSDTSESIGLTHTVDLMFAVISTEELEKLNRVLIKQLKNRYNDISKNKKYMIGIDRSKMTLYNISDDEQEGLIDTTPIMDKSDLFSGTKSKKFDKEKFDNFFS